MVSIIEKIIAMLKGDPSYFFSLLLSLIGGLISLWPLLREKLGGKERAESYSNKLKKLTEAILKSSKDMDRLLVELSTVASNRATSVDRLESDLRNLEEHERHLKKRVGDLQTVPIPVAEHFAALMAKGERRSALRDYLLFALGVVVSALVSILLKAFNLG